MSTSVREYVGSRYVPIFGRKDEDSIAWDNTKPYEPLTIVLYEGNSYTSRQYVPTGIAITNEEYWAITGNYNAQIEQYRQEVSSMSDTVAQNTSDIADIKEDIELENLEFSFERNAAYKYVDFTHAFDIEIPVGYYTQGATYADGHIYVACVPTNSNSDSYPMILMADATDGSVEETYYFIEYPNVGHMNSINYDDVTEQIIIYSGNKYVTRMNKDLTFSSQHTNTNSNAFSQFAITSARLVCNLTGTNLYMFFNRISENLFISYGVKEIPQARGNLNILQDMCAFNNACYSLSSRATNKNACINMFGFNGQQVCTFVFPIDGIEFEGIFTANNKMWIVGANGEVYNAATSNFTTQINNILNTASIGMENCYNTYLPTFVKYDDIKDDYVRMIEVDASAAGDSSYINKWQMRYPNWVNPFGHSYLYEPIPFKLGYGTAFGYSTASNLFRAKANFGPIQIGIETTKSGQYQYISKITLFDGSHYLSQTFADTDTDEQLATKLRNLYTNSDVHLPNAASGQNTFGNNDFGVYKIYQQPFKFETSNQNTCWQWL